MQAPVQEKSDRGTNRLKLGSLKLSFHPKEKRKQEIPRRLKT